MPTPPAPTGTIECVITPWYHKRMAMMGGLLLVFALWFFKDGKWTWPEERRQAEVMTDHRRLRDDYDKAKTEGRLAAWTADAKAHGYPLDNEGMLMKWASYAAEKSWPEDPKLRTPTEIEQQFYYAGGAGIGALIVAGLWLTQRRRKLVGNDDHFISPEGAVVRFAEVFRVDKRKWDDKGLAYVSYRAGSTEKTAVIDDLKFDGAVHVLVRVLANFSGELIEKLQEPDEPAESPENEAKTSADDGAK
jgi:hypothetical protein